LKIFLNRHRAAPGVCRASRIKPPKIADQAVFYLASSVEPKVRGRPDNRDFCATGDAKIYKRNRLPGIVLVLLLAACAGAPKPLDIPLESGFPLDAGGRAYAYIDVEKARPVLDRISFAGLDQSDTAMIFERTSYAVAGFYPPESGKTAQFSAWGRYPSSRAGFALGTSRGWKRMKSENRQRFWYSPRTGASVALEAGRAFAALSPPGAADAGAPNPFALPPGVPLPEGFTEFRRDAALAFWLEEPEGYLNRFLSAMNLPLRIPAESFMASLHPLPAEIGGNAGSGEQPEEQVYESRIRIKTPQASQARGLVTLFSMARFFLSQAAQKPEVQNSDASETVALLSLLFTNPPSLEGPFLNLRSAPMSGKDIALLFNLFSVYSSQN
jgi:hypothetical protein